MHSLYHYLFGYENDEEADETVKRARNDCLIKIRNREYKLNKVCKPLYKLPNLWKRKKKRRFIL